MIETDPKTTLEETRPPRWYAEREALLWLYLHQIFGGGSDAEIIATARLLFPGVKP